MRKICFIFVLLISSHAKLFAQQDSVRNIVQQRQLYFSDSLSMISYSFAKLSPLFLSQLMPAQLSTISAGHQFEKGKFVNAQGSTQTNTVFLSSEGITDLKGIKLFGAFNYQKTMEDSTRFSHQTRNNPTTPYYFGSPANNHYERSTYDFKVIGAKTLSGNKITLGIGLDYRIADHFANNDPRGSVKEYQLNMRGMLGYNVADNVKFGLTYLVGYGQEKVTIGYKNRTYYESISYPNYVNYLINGYGEPIPKTSERNYNDFQTRSGLATSFAAANTKLGSFYFIGTKVNEKQVYDYRTGSEITDLSYYNLAKLDLNLLWIKPIFAGNLGVNIAYENLAGEDFNLDFFAKNYVYTGQKINLQVNYTITKNSSTYNYLIGAKQTSEERIDGITGNLVYFKNVLLNAGLGVNRKVANHKSFGAYAGVHYGLPVTEKLQVSEANESYFTKEVIRYNYLFNTANRYGVSASATYSFPFFNTMQAAVKVNAVYSKNDKMKNLQRPTTAIPGNERFFNNISFNLYF
ncbi:DUF6850 family outer membrane beta-barrel protein [Pedobacter insulae]|uniref:DUF6850 domain-containing protein n=1 Tax=Pedobacter insulae TaxID=414048 RepID=A0A1I2YKJ5_9SPHI|nr:DUF6850 family outer membrane beta-barrel protein [Pedobacter insulae]SFH26165.1 hypothetical protein SAMN04489864_107167 [Pedobacter insulae]